MGEWAEAEFPTTAASRHWRLERKTNSLQLEDSDCWGITRRKDGRLGGESPAVPPVLGAGPCARLWRGACEEGAARGRRRRLSVLFARASITLWVRRSVGAVGSVPRGPVRRKLLRADSTRELDFPGGSRGSPGS